MRAVEDESDKRLARLHRIIEEQSLLRGDFTLSSGRKSTYLFQLRQTMLHPEGSVLIGELTVEFMRRQGLKCVGGLALGAVPFVAAVAAMSQLGGYPVAAFFVRKEAKQHGAKELLDGHLTTGADVLVIDDVATTGGSMLRAVDVVREHGSSVSTALAIIDREEGAAEELAKHGIRIYSLFAKSDFNV
jgi:orotate phosphoribosyltransferase